MSREPLRRFVLTIDEPIDPDGRLAGLQVRVFEMARALSRRGCDVAILGARDSGGTGGVGRPINAGDVKQFGPHLWICHPLLLPRYRALLGDARLALDCYEAPFASFLNYAVSAPPERQRAAEASYRSVIATYCWGLGRADLVLTANARQQASILTLLALFGWLDPLAPVEEQVLVVPSGAPPDLLPTAPPSRLGVSEQGPVVLWAGGAYPWFDLENVARACQLVLERVPTARFVFAGVHGRDEATGARQQAGHEIHQAVERIPRLAARVHFVPWVPYRDRARLYEGADIAISVHRAHTETFFSMRARVLDFVGAALPVVMTGGDAISERLASEDAARVVSPGDASALSNAVIGLLASPDERLAVSAAMRSLAQGALSWDAAIQPLLRQPAGAATRGVSRRSAECPGVVSAPSRAWRRLHERWAVFGSRTRLALAQRLHR